MIQRHTNQLARESAPFPAPKAHFFPAPKAYFFPGGVRLPALDAQSPHDPISNAAVPARAVISMRQHAGDAAQCMVRPGDIVREGMQIGRGFGPRSTHVHASIPGRVVAIEEAPDGAGGTAPAVIIELEGEFDRSGRAARIRRWEELGQVELLAAVQAAGIVDMGRGSVPAHLKLARRPGDAPCLLVVNGVRDDPSVPCVSSLLAGRVRDTVEGIRIAAKLLGPSRTVLAVGGLDRDLVPAFERAVDAAGGGIDLAVVSSRYPQSDEELLGAVVSRPGDGAAVVLAVGALLAVRDAAVLDRPLIETVVSVAGSIVRSPRTLKARLGTRVGDLLEECGGCTEEPAAIVLGGLMAGRSAGSADAPLTKNVAGVVALSAREARSPRALPCIRCGACIDACPWGLDPGSLCKLLAHGGCLQARAEGIDACSLCGCCAHVCPSRIPLTAALAAGRLQGGTT
jgi:Na+-translocating ferredoxin:NAD+ oxidoreductase subunit C